MSLAILDPSSGAPDQPYCLSNLLVCGASCCKSVSFKLTPAMIAAIKPEPAEYHITARITPDLRFYYQLHGYKPSRDGISVFLVPGNHEVKGDTLIIYQRCSWLTEDLRCKHHDRKPTLCGSLNYKNAKQGRFTLTKGCLLEEPQ